MRSEQYRDKEFAQYYQGLVSGSDDEKALVFAHSHNMSKLDENTRQINADGTFRTAPAMRLSHFSQILIIMATYKAHMFPVVKAVMTNKTRSLYDTPKPFSQKQ